MNDSNRSLALAARALLGLIFLVAGIRKLMSYGATVGYFGQLGIPVPDLVLPLVIALEVGGSLLLIAGWRVQWLSGLFALFCLGSAFAAHAFWSSPPAQFGGQLNNFLKNVAMVGGFLMVIVHARSGRAGRPA